MSLGHIPFLIHLDQYDTGSPFTAKTPSTYLGRLYMMFRGGFIRIFDDSFRSAFVRSGTDVGTGGPGNHSPL